MRLIDADALYEKTAEWEARALAVVEKLNEKPFEEMDANEITEWRKWSCILGERSAFKHDVADAPTIEPERKTGRWIPVTEALPNTPIKHPSRYGVGEYCESKPLIFQLVNKEDDDIFYTGMLSGCYCDDLNGYTYFATADACSFEIEKVAAWMPLPEPYEGGK